MGRNNRKWMGEKTSAITSFINFSALVMFSKVPISSTGLEIERGSASASLTIWILAPELSCRDLIVSPALPIRTPTCKWTTDMRKTLLRGASKSFLLSLGRRNRLLFHRMTWSRNFIMSMCYHLNWCPLSRYLFAHFFV